MRIKLAYSKNNNKINNIEDNINNINNIYKTQPAINDSNKKKFGSNIFPLKNDFIIESNNRRDNMNNINMGNNVSNIKHVTPSTKTAYYDISSHILNESLHIPNTENVNPNLNNNSIDLE